MNIIHAFSVSINTSLVSSHTRVYYDRHMNKLFIAHSERKMFNDQIHTKKKKKKKKFISGATM